MKRQISPIVNIPIATIEVLNPRTRGKQNFKEIVTSIAHLGLKRPITVSTRHGSDRYELVCGQGRMEAFTALGYSEIPSLLVDVPTEDCILMGLVENLARFRPSSLELVSEVGRLAKSCTIKEIAARLDLAPEFVVSICYLLKHGEERLLNVVEKKRIPHTVAVEIARAKDGRLQHTLIKTFERTKLTTTQMAAIRRLAEERLRKGAAIYANGRRKKENKGLNASELLRAYRTETERRTSMIKKAELGHVRLLFILNALRTLLMERMFVTLLREESMDKLPLQLLRRINAEH